MKPRTVLRAVLGVPRPGPVPSKSELARRLRESESARVALEVRLTAAQSENESLYEELRLMRGTRPQPRPEARA